MNASRTEGTTSINGSESLSETDNDDSHYLGVDPVPGGVGAGLSMWYKADEEVYVDDDVNLAIDGQNIQRWGDQSGNNYDGLQNNAVRRPIYDLSLIHI